MIKEPTTFVAKRVIFRFRKFFNIQYKWKYRVFFHKGWIPNGKILLVKHIAWNFYNELFITFVNNKQTTYTKNVFVFNNDVLFKTVHLVRNNEEKKYNFCILSFEIKNFPQYNFITLLFYLVLTDVFQTINWSALSSKKIKTHGPIHVFFNNCVQSFWNVIQVTSTF